MRKVPREVPGFSLPVELRSDIQHAGYYPALVADVVGATKLVVVHADDHDDHHERAVATATSESIPLAAVRGVMLAHVVANPDAYVPGSLGREITLTLGWGAVSRLDVMPASCGDPQCEADHGFEGTLAADDISLRISADADGDAALARALHFASALSATIGR